MSTEHLQRMLETAQEQQRIKDLTSLPPDIAAPYVPECLGDPGAPWRVVGPDGKHIGAIYDYEGAAWHAASLFNECWRSGLSAGRCLNVPAIWREQAAPFCSDATCPCQGPEE
jgi:hypothetical protein